MAHLHILHRIRIGRRSEDNGNNFRPNRCRTLRARWVSRVELVCFSIAHAAIKDNVVSTTTYNQTRRSTTNVMEDVVKTPC